MILKVVQNKGKKESERVKRVGMGGRKSSRCYKGHKAVGSVRQYGAVRVLFSRCC